MDYPPLEQQLGMFAKPRMDNKKIKHSYRDANQYLCDYIDLVNKVWEHSIRSPDKKISEIKALFHHIDQPHSKIALGEVLLNKAWNGKN